MFATLVVMNGKLIRSSLFPTLHERLPDKPWIESAMEYTERMPGIIGISEIGGDIVWKRDSNDPIWKRFKKE